MSTKALSNPLLKPFAILLTLALFTGLFLRRLKLE